MGTAAFIALENKGHISKNVIGMTHDGTVQNLEYLAKKINELRQSLPKQTDEDSLIKKIIELHPDWLFLSKKEETIWISYSMLVDTEKNLYSIYDGDLEEHIKSFEFKNKTSLFLYVVVHDQSEEGLFTECFELQSTKKDYKKTLKEIQLKGSEVFQSDQVLEYIISTQPDGLVNGIDKKQIIKKETKDSLYKYIN